MNPEDDPLSRRRFVVATATAVAAAGASGTALAQDGEGEEGGNGEGGEGDGEGGGNGEGGEGDGNESGGNESGGGGGGGGSETVSVVDNAFEPAELAVEPGTTVEWVWEGTEAEHNVNPGEIPEEADWEGHQDLESGDFSFEHTFDVEGDYEYVCDPHVGQGMTGTITVDPDAAQQAAADGPIQLVPDAAWTLVIATVAGMVSTLSLVYAFMRYGGSQPEQ